MKPLSIRQKAALAQLARQSFEHQTAKGHISGISADDYRRDECERATGCAGLRECNASHYETLMAHFSDLAGCADIALNQLLRGQSNKRRQIDYVIRQKLGKAGLPIEYARSIALDKFRAPVEDLDERQLKQLLVTIAARAASRSRQASPLPSDGRGIKGEGVGSTNSQPPAFN